MKTYCFKCRKNNDSKNPEVSKTNKGRIILLSQYTLRDNKKLRFVKKQEASELFRSLAIKTSLSKIPLIGNILF